MAYGAKIYDAIGRDITGIFSPIFFLASYSSESGMVDFGAIPAGKSLKYYLTAIADYKGHEVSVTVQVSGSIASWRGLKSEYSSLIFYWG
ncbi:hypothetical protein PT300_13185 [Enterobacteriaceae bacterium ESL0689]|nr:hypothetical protein [Enterobacteriaceae bacterium ESL0689]